MIQHRQYLTPAPIQQVRIDDAFWSPKLRTFREVTIPDCFDKFASDGAMRNFDMIAQAMAGEHFGKPWYDGLIYEMIRGSADFLATQRDPVLEARLDAYIDQIAAASAKDPDGYLNTWTQMEAPDHRWGMHGGDDNWQHDLFNAGCLVEAAVHYYRATGKTSLLRTAVTLANHMCDVMGPTPKANVVPGHSLPELAFVELYCLFREQPELKAQMPVPVEEAHYLHLVEFWLETRGRHDGRTGAQSGFGSYAQDHQPLLEQQTIEGHAVRATLLCAGLVAAAMENGRADYLATAHRLWENIVSRRLYLTGGIGSVGAYEGFGPDYELPNTGYLETCAAITAAFFHQLMGQVTANARYVDELERALYNGILSGVSLDGAHYFYTNPLEAGPDHARWDWNDCPCCPPMFVKAMGALPGMIYSQGADALYVNLFIGSQAHLRIGQQPVKVRQQTRYPWNGEVTLTITPERSAEFTLNVRIPGWCEDARLAVNGGEVSIRMENGYAVLARMWQPGDTVTLHLPMPVRRMKAHPKVTVNAGCVALMRGPLVYCLESLDQPAPLQNLALSSAAEITAEYHPDLLGGITVLTGSAQVMAAAPWSHVLYLPTEGVTDRMPASFTAIPFYANSNRVPSSLRVWLAETAEYDAIVHNIQ